MNTIEEQIAFSDLATRFGITDLDTPGVYDISGEEYEILSFDTEKKERVWSPLTSFVVKAGSPSHYNLYGLRGTAEHRVLLLDQWVALKDHPSAVLVDRPIQVVDCEVADTHTYLAEGQINHNSTTPGGKAVPYHASLRIKLGSGSPIKKTINGKEAVIGISVSAKTIKNKVARPWREVDFEIIFGKGIQENEQLFDALREFCEKADHPCIYEGKKVTVEGVGAWKTFTVSDTRTGEVLEDIKFHKSEFGNKVLSVPRLKPHVDALLDACFIMQTDNHHTVSSVDVASIEEVEAAEIG